MEIQQAFEDARRVYEAAGITGRVGFGERPAVIVVDLCLAFTDPHSPLGCDLSPVVGSVRRLLEAARPAGWPVVFTTMGYRSDMKDAGVWPGKFLKLDTLQYDSEYRHLDPRLGARPEDVIIRKDYPSAFFGTSLVSMLTSWRVDTVVVCGTTTSGCVRATAVDGLQYGFRVIVPRECVGDRAELPHLSNLFDIDSKYGDVVSIEEVLEQTERLRLHDLNRA